MSDRVPRFLSGWKYVTTPAEADALPTGSAAIVDDEFLWDGDRWTKGAACYDGVVDVQQSDIEHRCDPGPCDEKGCRNEWFETNCLRPSPRPPLPFFAWHPTFCAEK